MNNKFISGQAYSAAGMFTLSLRLVTGWTYFSAFWRRLALTNKLDPDTAGYIGEKFNHFLPNALFIKPGIEYLVTHEQVLWWSMLVFTIVEGVAGLFFILGLYTRLMSVIVGMLAMGILLGAGWLGTTCLDEWQIGVLGIAAGFTIFLSGGGRYSTDHYLQRSRTRRNWYAWISSGHLSIGGDSLRKIALAGAVTITGLTLFTNQYFHGGVWGKLHNLSVRPNVQISAAQLTEEGLSFDVFRNEGADVYGSFLIGVTLLDADSAILYHADGSMLATSGTLEIDNHYVAKVKQGKHSLVLPLGAKATLRFAGVTPRVQTKQRYLLVLTDISGTTWTKDINI